jgi:hypothetical protein
VPEIDKCIFCGKELQPGSLEHAFPSAIGGRIASKRALCLSCNNHFSSAAGDDIDKALADAFVPIRNALMIWTGRDKAPPTIKNAGSFGNGLDYDLAPGYVPLARPGRLPNVHPSGGQYSLIAKSTEDAAKILNILEKRGYNIDVKQAERTLTKAPVTKISTSFDGLKIYRSVAKSAVVIASIIYGNNKARKAAHHDLISAIKTGNPSIAQFAGWDYKNPYPTNGALRQHRNSPGGIVSGFEHIAFIADVNGSWIAYLELFGQFRFTVWLGQSSGYEPRGLAVNPRSSSLSRFEYSAETPKLYSRRSENSYRDEFELNSQKIGAAFEAVLSQWQKEASHANVEAQAAKLAERIKGAGADEIARANVISEWAAEVATLEMGGAWRETLDPTIIDEW